MLDSVLDQWLWPACAWLGPVLAVLHAALHPLDFWGCRGAADGDLEPADDAGYAVPLLGSFFASLLGRASFQEDVDALHRRHGGAAAVGAFEWRGRPCVLLRAPALVARLLTGGPMASSVPQDVRRRLSPLLLAGRVDATARLMADCADQLVQAIAEQVHVGAGKVDLELLGPLGRFSTGVAGACAFGVPCNCIQDPAWELHRVAREAHRPGPLSLLALAVVTALPSAAAAIPARVLYPAAACFYADMQCESAAFRERTRTRRRDFVDLMMRTVRVGDGTDGFLTDKDRRLHCGLAFDVVAAHAFVLHAHTHVPRIVAACLLELARQPGLQQRVAQEVRRVLDGVPDEIRDAPGPLTGLQVLQNTPLLEQVLLEALRLYPPCGVLVSEVGAEGLVLPARGESQAQAPDLRLVPGTRVYVAVRALQRDPEIYKDPSRFDPSRFSPEARRSRAPGAYVPFGEVPAPAAADMSAPSGPPPPAVSTGARFALQEMWLCLAALLADLQFDLCPRTSTTAMSDDDVQELWLRVQRRGQAAALVSAATVPV